MALPLNLSLMSPNMGVIIIFILLFTFIVGFVMLAPTQPYLLWKWVLQILGYLMGGLHLYTALTTRSITLALFGLLIIYSNFRFIKWIFPPEGGE